MYLCLCIYGHHELLVLMLIWYSITYTLHVSHPSVVFVFQSAYDSIKLDLDTALRHDIYFGAKLVRGAYMEQVSGWLPSRKI